MWVYFSVFKVKIRSLLFAIDAGCAKWIFGIKQKISNIWVLALVITNLFFSKNVSLVTYLRLSNEFYFVVCWEGPWDIFHLLLSGQNIRQTQKVSWAGVLGDHQSLLSSKLHSMCFVFLLGKCNYIPTKQERINSMWLLPCTLRESILSCRMPVWDADKH